MKGLGSLLSFILLVGITLAAIAIVLSTSQGTIGDAITSVDIKDADAMLGMLGNRIREVASEGNGSVRIVSFTTPGSFEIIGKEDAIQFETPTNFFDYFTRSMKRDIIYINGNDVSCRRADIDGDGDADLVLENSFARAAFQNASGQINTSKNIVEFYSKPLNSYITFSDTSVTIDNDPASAAGPGFSEILREGSNLPECTVHVFVHATVDYDVYYTLYAGADFITAEVRLR